MSLERMFCCLRIGSSAEVAEDLSSGGAEIPEDLLIEILLRVPAKFVTKFRRLSKFHRDWMDSSDFIRKHYNVSMKRTNCSHIIVTPNNLTWGGSDVNTDYQVMRLDSTEFGARVEKSINSFKERGYGIVDSSMGILCLLLSPETGRDGHILLWNPLMGGRRMIDIASYGYDFTPSCFLGHEAATDDLKILKIRAKHPISSEPSVSHCEIYSYRTGSWRNIGDNNFGALPFWGHRILVEGTNSIHTIDPRDKNIITFDFSLEKFDRIPLPTQFSSMYTHPYQCRLLDLDGCLCIGAFRLPCEACASPCWSVWGMKEYGVEESWTWLFCVHDFVCTSSPSVSLQFVNGGRQLLVLSTEPGLFISESGQRLEELHPYEVCLYDFEDKKLIKYEKQLTAIRPLQRPPRHVLYVPSLKQVGQFCPE